MFTEDYGFSYKLTVDKYVGTTGDILTTNNKSELINFFKRYSKSYT